MIEKKNKTNVKLTHQAANVLLQEMLNQILPDNSITLRIRNTKDVTRKVKLIGRDDPLVKDLVQVIRAGK